MKKLVWSERLSVGLDEIDGQHMKFIEGINSLYDGLRLGGGKTSVYAALDRLEEYYTIHFDSEERFMESFGFEGLKEHKKEHQMFRERMTRFRARLDSGEGAKTLLMHQLVDYMDEWLEKHLLNLDMKYAKSYRESGL